MYKCENIMQLVFFFWCNEILLAVQCIVAYMESLLLESIDNFYLITVYLLCLKWHKEINYLSSSIWKSTFISRDKFIRTRRRCWWNPSRIVTLPPHSVLQKQPIQKQRLQQKPLSVESVVSATKMPIELYGRIPITKKHKSLRYINKSFV